MSLYRASMVEMSSPNASWPWTHVTKVQLFNLAQPIALNNGIQEAMQLYGSLFNAFGVFLSALGIGVFWRKGVQEKNTFFSAMMLISGLDLAFNLVHLPFVIWYPTYKMNGGTSDTALWTILVIRGAAFTVSLVSDMCTLVLTAERCLAISNPIMHMKWTTGIRRRVLLVIGLLFISAISLARTHYSMHLSVVKSASKYQYVASAFGSTMFVKNLTTFSDLILPFSLLILMICLSARFLASIISRHRSKSKVNNWVGEMTSRRAEGTKNTASTTATTTTTGTNITTTTSNNNNNNSRDRSSSSEQKMRQMIVLTLVLDTLYIFNQIGFTLIAIASLMKSSISELTFDMNYDDMSRWCTAQLLDQNAALASRWSYDVSALSDPERINPEIKKL